LVVENSRLLQHTVDLLELNVTLVSRELPLSAQVSDDLVKLAGLLLATHTDQLATEVTQRVQLRPQRVQLSTQHLYITVGRHVISQTSTN